MLLAPSTISQFLRSFKGILNSVPDILYPFLSSLKLTYDLDLRHLKIERGSFKFSSNITLMKNTYILFYFLLLSPLFILTNLWAQKKETVTITGKVTVKDTGKPPIGIITVSDKGTVDYYAAGDFPSTYRHTFLEKDGSFTFTINKGGTIVIQDGGNRYKQIILKDLKLSQNLALTLDRTKRTNPPAYSANELLAHEKKTDIHKRIKINGKITDPSGKPIENAVISQPDVFTDEVTQSTAHTTTDKNGNYSYTVLKGGRISFTAGRDFKRETLTATKDTVINIKMMRINPFK